MEYLLIVKGANQGQRIPLNGKSKIVLGRSADCDVVINDPAVSRTHAQILRIQGRLYLEDIKSRNNTFVNGQQVLTRTALQDSDRIKICDCVFTYHDDEKPKSTPELPILEEAAGEPETSSTIEVTVSDSTRKILQSQTTDTLNKVLEITTRLARTFQLHLLLPEIIDSLFQLFKQADRGFIILREEEGSPLVPRAVKTRHVRESSTPRFSRRIVQHCIDTGHAVLSKDAMKDPQFALSDPGDSIVESRIRSVMCVPLLARDTSKPFGVIQLDTQDRSKKFTAEDLKLLVALAGQAAIAVENARLYQDMHLREQMERDMALARQVMLSILPEHEQLPSIPSYEFFAHYASALEVGGDYYDFVPLPGRRLAVMIGDVAGKGMPAALLMAKLFSDARYCLLAEQEPATAVARINNLMCPACHRTDRFITLLMAVLDLEQHTATLINAGHLIPLLYRRTGNVLQDALPEMAGGLPVGIRKDTTYTVGTVRLEPGDGLILFTDGVTDAEDKQKKRFQLGQVHEILENGSFGPQAMGERLVTAVKQYSLGCKQQDDITVVCFGRIG